jgi:hypothetical protein
MTFPIIVSALALVVILLLTRKLRVSTTGRVERDKKLHTDEIAILDLTLAEAKIQALRLLEDVEKFQTVINELSDDAKLSELSPQLRTLFGKYHSITETYGEASLNRDLIKPYKNSEFIQIGVDFDQTTLTVKSYEEAIYIFDGSESEIDNCDILDYPSIYHWLLIKNRILYDNN